MDKYPELVFRVGFIKAIFPDAKFCFWSGTVGTHIILSSNGLRDLERESTESCMIGGE